jgi:hypothetical protein
LLKFRSVADPGCLSRIRLFSIPDPNFFHPVSRIRIKEFKYINPKNGFEALGNMIRVCSSRIRILTFYPSRIPDPGVKKAPDPGSGFAALQIWIPIRSAHLKVVGCDDGDVGGLDAGGHKAAHVMAHQRGFTLVT